MEQKTNKLVVLARIPNLSTKGPAADCTTPPVEGGRLVSQVTAFRLLAATALVLVAVAVIPLSAGKKAAAPESASVELPASASATVVTSTPAPVVVSPVVTSNPPVAQPEVVVAQPKAADDGTQMSVWPNPDHPIAAQTETSVEGSQSSVNRPMTIQPPVYEADARARR